jgi:hypothetical protein
MAPAWFRSLDRGPVAHDPCNFAFGKCGLRVLAVDAVDAVETLSGVG